MADRLRVTQGPESGADGVLATVEPVEAAFEGREVLVREQQQVRRSVLAYADDHDVAGVFDHIAPGVGQGEAAVAASRVGAGFHAPPPHVLSERVRGEEIVGRIERWSPRSVYPAGAFIDELVDVYVPMKGDRGWMFDPSRRMVYASLVALYKLSAIDSHLTADAEPEIAIAVELGRRGAAFYTGFEGPVCSAILKSHGGTARFGAGEIRAGMVEAARRRDEAIRLRPERAKRDAEERREAEARAAEDRPLRASDDAVSSVAMSGGPHVNAGAIEAKPLVWHEHADERAVVHQAASQMVYEPGDPMLYVIEEHAAGATLTAAKELIEEPERHADVSEAKAAAERIEKRAITEAERVWVEARGE